MPIKGLTDRSKSFLRLAKIKKGEKDPETGAPRDLDYFRTIFSYGCEDVEAEFKKVYGEKPTRINMRLAFRNISEVWDAFYVAYETGGLLAKAGSDENGPYWVWYRDHDTKEVWVRDGHPVGPDGQAFMAKPIDLSAPIYSYKNKKTGEVVPVYLEPEGRLSIVVPEVASIDGKPRVGFFEFCPGSPRDIGAISGELAAIDLWAKQVGKDITGIPMVLTRRKEMVTKKIKGVLSQGPSWVVHIEVGGEWGGKALEFMQMKALPDNIVDGEVIETEDGEFQDVDPTLTPPAPFSATPVKDSRKSALAPEPEYVPPFPSTPPGEKPAPEATKKPEVKKAEPAATGSAKRPYPPDVFLEKFTNAVIAIEKNYADADKDCEATDMQRNVIGSILTNSVFGKDSMARHEFLGWLCGEQSVHSISCAQVHALLKILNITGNDFKQIPDKIASAEMQQAHRFIVASMTEK